ncbi:MAG: hypothetical protein V3S46_09125, partial [Nitrospinota bacterium]
MTNKSGIKRLNWILALIVAVLIFIVIGVAQMFSILGKKIEQQMANEFNQQQLVLARHIKDRIEDNVLFVESYLETVSGESELK